MGHRFRAPITYHLFITRQRGVDSLDKPRTTSSPRAGLGGFFRGILGFLDKEGLRAEVRGRVPPDTARLMDAPPSALAWVDSVHIDAIETQLLALRGAAGCVELGLQVARGLGGGMIEPVIRAAFFLFGETPPAIFENLDRFFSLTTRGLHFSWRTLSADAGEIEARIDGPGVPIASLHVLQGTFQYAFELTGVQGQVGGAELRTQDAGGTVAVYRVFLRR